jgi:amino acid transporter
LFGVADEQGVESGVFDALAEPVLGSPWDKLVLLSVLTSGLASTQTTILPASRTALSMAVHRALPRALGQVSPRFFTPAVATILVGALALAWYVPLNLFAQNSLFDSLQALSLLIAFYYGINGISCVVYYRDKIFKPGSIRMAVAGLLGLGGLTFLIGGVGNYYEWSPEGLYDALIWVAAASFAAGLVAIVVGGRDLKSAVMIGIAPLVGATMLLFVLVRSALDLADPVNSSSGETWLGVTPALVMGTGLLAVGIILMFVMRATSRSGYFDRRRESLTDATPTPAELREG